MNKKIIYFFMLALSFTLFTACGDDDDDENVTDYASQIAATYKGTLKINVTGLENELSQDNNIILSRSGVNKIKLELKGLILPGDIMTQGQRNIGDVTITVDGIVVDGIDVSKKGDDIVMTEKNTSVTLTTGGFPLTTVDVKVSEGKVAGNTLSFKINVPEVGVNASFSGTK